MTHSCFLFRALPLVRRQRSQQMPGKLCLPYSPKPTTDWYRGTKSWPLDSIYDITLAPFKLPQGLSLKPDTRGDHVLARLLPLFHFPHFLRSFFSRDHPLNNTLAIYSFQDQLLGSLFQNRHQENSSGIGMTLPTFKVMTVVKNPPANAGDLRDLASIPGSGRSPGGGHGNPVQYSWWRIPWTEEQGRLQSIGCKESDTTETT